MKNVFFMIILSLVVASTAMSMDQVFRLIGKDNAQQCLALDVAQTLPYLQQLMQESKYVLTLPDASSKDLICLASYLIKRSANCIFSNSGSTVIAPSTSFDTEKSMDISDIKKLIGYATLLFGKYVVGSMDLLETWRKKVEEENLWDNEGDCSIDYISKKDGVPLIDGVWCKKFLLTKDRAFVAQAGTLYELIWNNKNKKFEQPKELQSFALQTILNIQMNPKKTQLFISTIQKEFKSGNSFLSKVYQWSCEEKKILKVWGPGILADEETYKDRYLKGYLKVNDEQIKHAEDHQKDPNFDWWSLIMKKQPSNPLDQTNTQASWLPPKMIICGAVAVIAAILLGVGLKTYLKR